MTVMQAASIPAFALVAAGGAMGAMLRHGTGLVAARMFGLGFPWGTLIVNVIGSFLIACVVAYAVLRGEGGLGMRLFLATGLLGGFTTFSAFSLDTLSLAERGDTGLAAAYVLASVVLSIGACFLGLWFSRSVL